jgi:mono/diheme cytochrome c family protein
MRRLPLALMLPLMLAACGGGGGGEQANTPSDSVALALEQYDPALFDTISWTSDSSEVNRGGIVWAFSCKKCHGQLGKGDGNQVIDGDTIRPPDFTTQWRFGTDDEGLMKAIYAGSAEGMPHWGLSGLKPRDIDAVATYVQKVLVGLGENAVQTPTDTMQ